MKAIHVPTGEKARIIDIEDYKFIDSILDDIIEPAYMFDGLSPVLYVGSTSKFNKPFNRAFPATKRYVGMMNFEGKIMKEGDVLDVMCGDFFVLGFDSHSGKERDLTEEEIELIMDMFEEPHSMTPGVLSYLEFFNAVTMRGEGTITALQ